MSGWRRRYEERSTRRAVCVGPRPAGRWRWVGGQRPRAVAGRSRGPPFVQSSLRAAVSCSNEHETGWGGGFGPGGRGGAALPQHVAELFDAIGIVLLEGYGLSEATCASHFNRPNRRRVGTVGLPLPGIGARLDVDGEILISGDTVFAGYLGDAAATASV